VTKKTSALKNSVYHFFWVLLSSYEIPVSLPMVKTSRKDSGTTGHIMEGKSLSAVFEIPVLILD